MPVPLTWLLAQEDLGLRAVSGDVEPVEIAWAHAIELEDPSPWLAGGELVLTTGIRLPRTIAEQTAYVERLHGVGVAALAFGVGLRYASIPRGVVERCAELGLPLVEVPLPTPFVAVAQRIAQRLADQDREALRRVVAFQQSVTRATLRDGAGGLVGGLSRELGCAVVLLDEHLHVVAASRGGAGLATAAAAGLAASPRPAGGAVTHRVEVDGTVAQAHALRGRAAHRGWLVVGRVADAVPDERLLLHHAVSLATLHLDRPRELEEAREAVGATVLGLLLEESPARAGVVRQLRHLGFGDGEELRVLWVGAASPQVLSGVVQSRLSAAAVVHALTAASDDGLAVLVPAASVEAVVRLLREALDETGQASAAVGVSGVVAPEGARGALTQARQAARSARQEREPVGWFERLTLQAVLSDEVVRTRVQELAGVALAPLLAADRFPASGGRLLAALEAYLAHNGSWETAARALGVHRHTLRSRVARVEELTGLSLDVAHNRVVLALALASRDTEPQP